MRRKSNANAQTQDLILLQTFNVSLQMTDAVCLFWVGKGNYRCRYFQTFVLPLDELCKISLTRYNLAIFFCTVASGPTRLITIKSTTSSAASARSIAYAIPLAIAPLRKSILRNNHKSFFCPAWPRKPLLARLASRSSSSSGSECGSSSVGSGGGGGIQYSPSIKRGRGDWCQE